VGRANLYIAKVCTRLSRRPLGLPRGDGLFGAGAALGRGERGVGGIRGGFGAGDALGRGESVCRRQAPTTTQQGGGGRKGWIGHKARAGCAAGGRGGVSGGLKTRLSPVVKSPKQGSGTQPRYLPRKHTLIER
jgi:hypothetical protein